MSSIPSPGEASQSGPPAYGGAGGPPVDVATLARLAGEFFATLPGGSVAPSLGAGAAGLPSSPPTGVPGAATGVRGLGGVPLPVNVLPAGAAVPPAAAGPVIPGALPESFGGGPVSGANVIPTSPQGAANLLASRPASVPHAVSGNGVPDSVLTAAPGLDSRFGGLALGVPQGVVGARPPVSPGETAPSPVPGAPSSPFYFLGESSAHRAAVPIDVPVNDGLDATAFGLPGNDALRGLLATPSRPAASSVAPSDSADAFYFLDRGRHPGPSGHHAGAIPNAAASAHPPFDVNAIRRDFPILAERVNGHQLTWFDNAATTHKPRAVIDRVSYFYEHENSNIHRAAHALAGRATDAYEAARQKTARFIGASSPDEIIFVRGCTEGINLVAKSWGEKHIGEGDEIIVSHLEHHANIVPWQQLATAKGAKLRVIPVDDSGQVILSEYQRLLGPRTRLVAATQVSNALGTVVPVQEIVAIAHRHGVCTLVDGAQSVSHMAVDVQAIDADFFIFSGHKVFGPTGIGVVYGKKAVLEDMPPWQGGGNMIVDVTFERTVYQGVPSRFEAGTGNIADAVGLGAAIDYVQGIGMHHIARYEHDLLEYATQAIKPTPGLRLIGTATDKASVLSFVLDGYKPEEVGRALNEEGIAVRSGHHCAQPILRRFGVEATVRPSLAFYNTCEEVDHLVRVVRRLARA